jgi:16S rRNA (guanine527-N7)-methyltransferase
LVRESTALSLALQSEFMHSARIAELLAPYLNPAVLSPAQLKDISTYIDLLTHWNARINLTAIRSEEEMVTRHFGESVFAARHLFPASPVNQDLDFDSDPSLPAQSDPTRHSVLRTRSSLLAADLGSGAGFPGIPIKLWAPEIHMTLIESNHKKSAFLREVVRSLTLTNIDIQTARAESLSQTYDVVTLRAVERFPLILSIAARLTKPSGCLALLIAASQIDQARAILPSFTWHDPISVPDSRSRLLAIASREPEQ